MEKDKDITKVIFRIFKDNGEIVALFPELPGDNHYYSCLSYMHLGQHGNAHSHYVVKVTTHATPEQYKKLFEELESIGYNLKVYKRITYKMYLNKIKILQGV